MVSRATARVCQVPHSDVHRRDAGAGRPLIASPGCGGGKAAASALLCVARVLLRPAWGPPRVPLQCRGWGGALRVLGRGEASAEGLGCHGPSLWECRAGAVQGPGPGAASSSRDLHPPRGLQSGGEGRGQRAW